MSTQSPVFLWKKYLDEGDDDPAEKSDKGVEQAEKEHADDDKESVRLDAGEEITDFSWREPHQDF